MKFSPWLLGITILMGALQPALSHPPGEVKLSFNAESHLLKVEALHPTKDVLKHIISKVEIKLNEKDLIEQIFLSQMNTEFQEVTFFIIDAKPGDEITVIAHCNVYGKKKGKIQIPEKQSGGAP